MSLSYLVFYFILKLVYFSFCAFTKSSRMITLGRLWIFFFFKKREKTYCASLMVRSHALWIMWPDIHVWGIALFLMGNVCPCCIHLCPGRSIFCRHRNQSAFLAVEWLFSWWIDPCPLEFILWLVVLAQSESFGEFYCEQGWPCYQILNMNKGYSMQRKELQLYSMFPLSCCLCAYCILPYKFGSCLCRF